MFIRIDESIVWTDGLSYATVYLSSFIGLVSEHLPCVSQEMSPTAGITISSKHANGCASCDLSYQRRVLRPQLKQKRQFQEQPCTHAISIKLETSMCSMNIIISIDRTISLYIFYSICGSEAQFFNIVSWNVKEQLEKYISKCSKI